MKTKQFKFKYAHLDMAQNSVLPLCEQQKSMQDCAFIFNTPWEIILSRTS